jgi:4-hydroxybenzoate polyprenyltransferase
MMLTQLSATAPLPLRLAAWARERFPLALCGVLFPAYLVALLYGRALTHPGPPRLRAGDLVAFAGVWAFFLMVRVVDEHKDYERDRVEHPGRVLQRGVVTLGHLKGVAGAALLVQVAVVLATGSGLWWALTMAWAGVQLGSGWPPAVAILPALAVGPLALLYRFATTGEPAPARTALAVLLPVQLMVAAAALLAGAGGW